MKFKSVNFSAGKCLPGKNVKAWNLKMTDLIGLICELSSFVTFRLTETLF